MKTLTTYEALKANETKRVRCKDGEWHEVGGLIDLLNRGYLDHKRVMEWEAEEPLIEQWVVVDDEGQVISSVDTEEKAARYANGRRIVHLREVRS